MATIDHESGWERKNSEKYYTPSDISLPLLRLIKPDPIVFDPCAGDGEILRACWSLGIPAYGADIQPEAPGIAQADFFKQTTPVRNIVTNPPYGSGGALAVRFIKHALVLTKPSGGKVAMLLRADFDSAPGRVGIFRDHPAWDRRAILLKRAKWTNIVHVPGKGPSTNHTWFVWDWSRPAGPATVDYIG